MRRAYINKRFSGRSEAIVVQAVQICQEYADQGYDLTLRQLYYQFVARGLIPNLQSEYKRLGGIVNDARLAGILDWDFIVDRTRNLTSLPFWASPAKVMDAVTSQYRTDIWEDQPYRVEVWVEKDALGGVIKRDADIYRAPWFSCRGYTSQSEMWSAAQRLRGYLERGQIPVILHLGDHDPSGIDMTRDIKERLELFMYRDWLDFQVPDLPQDLRTLSNIQDHMLNHIIDMDGFDDSPVLHEMLPLIINRIALNMNQVEEHNPPPNPTKFTDSRAGRYVEEFGYESWELDALEPSVLTSLIEAHIEDLIDFSRWENRIQLEEKDRDSLREARDSMRGSETNLI